MVRQTLRNASRDTVVAPTYRVELAVDCHRTVLNDPLVPSDNVRVPPLAALLVPSGANGARVSHVERARRRSAR
jgi:hypothetical protein